MERHNRKQVLDIFSQKLSRKFEVYCKDHNQNTSLENFITYLIDQEIITHNVVKQYAIVEVFNELYPSAEKLKTEVVNTVADRFNLTPRSIWNTLRKNTYAPNKLKIRSIHHKLR